MSLNLKYQNNWAGELNEQLVLVKSSTGHKRRIELDKLHKQIQFHLNAFKETQVIHDNLDELDSGYFSKLQNKFPNLTRSEQQLFSLIKINLHTHQIAQIKNIETSLLKILIKNEFKNKSFWKGKS